MSAKTISPVESLNDLMALPVNRTVSFWLVLEEMVALKVSLESDCTSVNKLQATHENKVNVARRINDFFMMSGF